MPAAAVETFLLTLQESHLLTGEQLAEVRDQIEQSGDASSPRQIARRLVERQLLTAWQARMLLQGNRAFFLGKYKLLEELGQGGMGTVLKAEQAPLGRLVAIKLMAKKLTRNPEAVARFRREIQAAARLSHPNIVLALDADCVDDAHFLVMEYAEGRDLRSVVRQLGRLPIGEACEYVRQTALGLQHAHERGIVHRDIKPSNLLLVRRAGERPIVKILDMGLARFVQTAGDESGLTQTGQVMGTPDYISPEQARDSRHADIKSDIYSLGCTLFRLLAGQVPFPGETVVERITARLMTDAPPVQSLRADIPDSLAQVVEKMLARDPQERYQTPAEVERALSAFAEELSDDSATIAWIEQDVNEVPSFERAEDPALQSAQSSSFDTGMAEFLQQLATAASQDEEPERSTIHTTGEANMAATMIDAGPVITRGGKKLQKRLQKRKRDDRRHLLYWLTGTAVFALLVGAYAVWERMNRTTLVVEWPESERIGGSLQVDGRELELPKRGKLEFISRKIMRTVRLTRKGYEPIEESLETAPGESTSFRPQWKPTPETVRRKQWDELKKQVAELNTKYEKTGLPNDFAEALEIKRRIDEYAQRWASTPQRVEAVGQLIAELPAPADALKREQINPYELKVAGGGDPGKAPVELVAVFGDSRLTHWGKVLSVEFSNNGRTIASPGTDGAINLWDAETGELQRQLVGQGGVFAAIYSLDGENLLSAGHDAAVRVWNISTGEELLRFNGHKSAVFCLAVSPDGKTIASGEVDGPVILWSITDGERVHTLEFPKTRVIGTAFSPNGKMLATACSDSTVKLWDVQTGKELHSFNGHTAAVMSVAFSPDGTLLASAADDQTAILWNLESQKQQVTFRPGGGTVRDVAFSSDGDMLACGCGSKDVNHKGSVSVWDVASGEPRLKFRAPTNGIHSIDFSPDGQHLVTGSGVGAVRVWTVQTGEERFKRRGHVGGVLCLGVSPDGRQLVSGGFDDTVRLWDIADGKQRQTLREHQNNVWSVAYSPDGALIASGGGDKTIVIRDARSGRPRLSLRESRKGVRSLSFSPNGERLISGHKYGDVSLWNTRLTTLTPIARSPQRTLSGERSVVSAAFSPNGELIAAGMREGVVSVWKSSLDGRPVLSFPQNTANSSSVCFSPDSRLLVSGGSGLKVWDLANNREHSVVNRIGTVLSTAFRPDGRVLASAGRGTGEIHFSSIGPKSGGPTQSLRVIPATGTIHEVTYTPDGRHVVTANGNGTIYVLRLKEWNAPPETDGEQETEIEKRARERARAGETFGR